MFLRFGVDFNIKDKYGYIPIDIATMNNSVKVISYLSKISL